MQKNNDRIYRVFQNIFISVFVLYLVIREIPPLNRFISSTFVSLGVFAVGFVFLCLNFFLDKATFADKRSDILFAFTAVTGISCVLNYKYGFSDNIKALGAMVLFLFFFFSVSANSDRRERLRMRNTALTTLNISWAVFCIISLGMYLYSIEYIIAGGSWGKTNQGFSSEYARLWGVFNDPNYAGYVSDSLIFVSLYNIKNKKSVFIKILNIANILLQLAFVTLSGSRSALVICICASFLSGLYFFGKSGANPKKFVLSTVKAFGCAAVCFALLFAGRYILPYMRYAAESIPDNAKTTINDFYDDLYETSGLDIFNTSVTPSGGQSVPGNNTDTNHSNTHTPITRTDTAGEVSDVSNGRITRWTQTLKIFLHSPLFGTSPRNLSQFAKENEPDTLMAKYGIAPHNGYLDVLAETGFIGFALFLIFFISILVSVIKRYFLFEKDDDFVLAVTIVFINALSALFVSDLFFVMTIGSFLFWTFCGYSVHTDNEENGGIIQRLIFQIFNRGKKG